MHAVEQDGRGGWRAVRELVSLYRAASPSTPESPGVVRSDDKSTALYRRALELGRGDIDDQAARDELRRLAGSGNKTLVRAEKQSRLGGSHREFEHRNRTYRLLYAALNDTPVGAITDADRDRIAALERSLGSGRSEGEIWEELCVREPRLRSFEDDVRQGRFGHGLDASTPARNQVDRAAAGATIESSHGGLRLMAQLHKIVGPTSGATDVVVASQRAYNLADRHLERLRPPRAAQPPRSE